MLKVNQVAKELNISTNTAYRWIKAGKIPAIKLGGSTIRIEEDALNRFLDDRRQPNKIK